MAMTGLGFLGKSLKAAHKATVGVAKAPVKVAKASLRGDVRSAALLGRKKKKAVDPAQAAADAAQTAAGGEPSVHTMNGPVARAAGRGFFGY
jgi:hypothetical protein